MKARISGIGVIGGFGCGTQSLEKAVMQQINQSSTPPAKLFGSEASVLNNQVLVADTSLLEQVVPPKALRRVDHYSRMAIMAASLALQDAQEDMGKELLGPIGVIVATGMGPTAGTLDSQSPAADAIDLRLSPIQFTNSVHNMAAAYISILLKIRGPNVSINHYDMSVPLAFQTALDWLEEGRASSVLVGGVDCFSKGLSNASLTSEDLKNPGSIRQPVPIGEGSAFFVLTRNETKKTLYASIDNVQIGRCLQDMALPANAIFLHNDSGEETKLLSPGTRHVSFSNVYGTFPSSMVLDLVIAALLLKQAPYQSELLTYFDFGQKFASCPTICCLKRGAAGNLGLIHVAP